MLSYVLNVSSLGWKDLSQVIKVGKSESSQVQGKDTEPDTENVKKTTSGGNQHCTAVSEFGNLNLHVPHKESGWVFCK
jgi:hypothetical protein